MIGVVIPAHNEEQFIGLCIESIRDAANCCRLQGEAVRIMVVCDNCSDATAVHALAAGAEVIHAGVRNVGSARATGARKLVQAGARWLSFTDADTIVSPAWLSEQLALETDAVCGTIEVGDWAAYGQRMRAHFIATYTDRDGHRHIHGANLGVSTRAYLAAGGFQSLASSEGVALVNALIASGATIAWSAAPRVVTSARSDFRAPGGFGATLQHIEKNALWAGGNANDRALASA